MNLELFGQRLSIVSDNSEEQVRSIVEFVGRKLEEVRDASSRVQTDQIALLAALNIAEALFEERRKNAELRREVRERSVKLLGAMDALAQDIHAARRASDSTEPS